MKKWEVKLLKNVHSRFPFFDIWGRIPERGIKYRFIRIAPYSSIFLLLFIAVFFVLRAPSGYELAFCGMALLLISGWAFIFLLVANSLKKRNRSPLLPLFLANLYPIFAIGLLLAHQAIRGYYEGEFNQFSHQVKHQFGETERFLAYKKTDIRNQAKDRMMQTERALNGMDAYLEHSPDRFFKEIDALYENRLSIEKIRDKASLKLEDSMEKNLERLQAAEDAMYPSHKTPSRRNENQKERIWNEDDSMFREDKATQN